ncbi:MAG: SUMF1/EgtB/PvdO family nonheme iron enzyme, partial [Candidatus Cloacimonetes bacterium]|nr:SUMF1/EgtB/PvdO family nonheme iron enzyme [Candidatus Cloacimonadota bacterium]
MKKIAALVLFFMILNILNALGTLHVKSVKELPATHTNLKVYDADGKYAPVLIIKTELKGLGIQNVGRPTKHAPEYMAGDHQYKFYMNDSQRVVKITHADYEPLEVRLLADFGIEVKAQRVYEMLLDNTPEKEFINVVIISDPVDATKIIDGKDMGTGQSFELFIGKHILKLQKNGFKSLTKNIEVSRSKTLFNNLELQEVEPVMITIKSEPDEADIYINNVNEGKTNKQLFKFPGNYNLRLVKDKYDTTEQNITVTESGTNTFDYTLQKNTSLLTINTTPSNCEIYVNNEKISGNSKEVSAGMYRVEVKKTGYYEQSRTVNVEKGRNKTESFILEQKTGKLQFVVEPMEAKITLKQGNSAVQSWNGSKYLSSLAIGNYTITASLSGYTSQTKQVKINLDETTKVNMSLQKGYEPPQSPFSGGSREGMVFVKGGTFQMGSNEQNDEKPIHSVTVSDFYIGKYEVTQKEWKAVMGSNPSNWKGDNLPVEKVSWYDAVEFCNKKSEKEGLQKCYNGSGANITCDFSKNGYRLPTEAEWEYAARGGNKSRNYKYSGSNKIDDVAWYTSNSGSKTHNVGTKQANELGIHDMSGNVWEWCNDWYDKNYYSSSPKNNPKGAYSGSYRIL